MSAMEASSFDAVRTRLEEIVDEVSAEGVTLDDALALYEEAVKLGLAACDLSEQDALAAAEAQEPAAAAEGAPADGAAGADASGAAGGAAADAADEQGAALAEDAR